jgi:hypothetical protein
MSTEGTVPPAPAGSEPQAAARRKAPSRDYWFRVRPLLFYAAGGAMGIVNGFALGYLLWAERGHSIIAFTAGVVAAAVLAFVIEVLRHWIQHPDDRSVSLSQVVSTFLVIMISELLIAAAHKAGPEIVHMFEHAGKATSGKEGAGVFPDRNMLLTAGIWVVVGAIVAGRLGQLLRSAPSGFLAGVKYGADKGAVSGFLIAFAAVAALGLLLRFFAVLDLAVPDPARPDAWQQYLQELRSDARNLDFITRIVAAWIPANALAFLGAIVGWIGAMGVVAAYLALLGGTALLAGVWRVRWPFFAVAALGIFYLCIPLVTSIKDESIPLLLVGAAFAGIVFGIPATILGALSPLWRHFQDRRGAWVAIAAAVGAILAVLTVVRASLPQEFELFNVPWWLLLLLSGLAIAAALLFWRKEEIIDLWPLAALLVALIVGIVTAFMATFVGVWAQLSVVNASLMPGYSIGPYTCLDDYRRELVWLQLSPSGKRLDELKAMREQLQTELARMRREPSVRDLCQPEIEGMLLRFDAYVVAAAEQHRWVKDGLAQRVEIAIAGSFGFWVTLVLLAGYRRSSARNQGEAAGGH